MRDTNDPDYGTFMKSKPDSQAAAVNQEFEKMHFALKMFRHFCATNDSPIRSVTYRVYDNGESKCHVVYKRATK